MVYSSLSPVVSRYWSPPPRWRSSTKARSSASEGTAAKRFQRVKEEEWLDKKGAWDNTYEGTFGSAGWGAKAQVWTEHLVTPIWGTRCLSAPQLSHHTKVVKVSLHIHVGHCTMFVGVASSEVPSCIA